MLRRPFGLCDKCFKVKCGVLTETNAKVIQCPDFEKKVSPAKNSVLKSHKTIKKQRV